MSKIFARAMTRATELTRSGRLHEATALIQSLLGNRKGADDSPTDTPADTALEGTFTRLDDVAPDPTPPAKPARRSTGTNAPRRNLAETLRDIAARRKPARPGVSVPVAPGARFLSLTHATPQGRRAYRLYVPAHRPAPAMPLLIMLHGCTQSPEDFAAGTGMNPLAEEFGWLIAYPAQPHDANAQKCWNWFRPADQVRDRGEPALIAGLTRDILRDHPADPARVYIAGLSAGGAAAALVATAYPDLFSAVGVHSGLPVGSARDVPSALSAMRTGASGKALPAAVPTIVFHGLADGTVHPDNGSAVTAQALNAQPNLDRIAVTGTAPGGRAFRQIRHLAPDGRSLVEHWEITGAGHAWSGGQPHGSYADPKGPDASREMLRFFMQHKRS